MEPREIVSVMKITKTSILISEAPGELLKKGDALFRQQLLGLPATLGFALLKTDT